MRRIDDRGALIWAPLSFYISSTYGASGENVDKPTATLAGLEGLPAIDRSGRGDGNETPITDAINDRNHHPPEGREAPFATLLNGRLKLLPQVPDLPIKGLYGHLGIEFEMLFLNPVVPWLLQECRPLQMQVLDFQEEHELRVHSLLGFGFQEFQELLRG